MFNFKKLKLDRRKDPENTSSFVGISKNSNNEMVFRLPRGFDRFPENNFEETKKLFFKMYRTFKKFERDNKDKQLTLDNKPTGKDNIETGGNSYQFEDKENNDVVLYSKISVIENLLEVYHDLALDIIERKSGRNEDIDYSKIDQYLHKAIYLDDDVIYVNEMELPRHFLNYSSATLIDLFCFILNELENELEQESDSRVKDLANRLKEQHLNYDQSLFNEESFESTILSLKEILDDIDKITAYKDEDYWRIYEVIESFLYGELDMQNTHEDGIFWGISNFYQIWEDMCNTYAFANFDDIIYADTNIFFNGKNVANYSFGGHKIFKKDNFCNPFFIEFRDMKRWMRPDLVYYLEENEISVFEKYIKIQITHTHNTGRINFNVKLILDSKKIIFQAFLQNLKQSLNRRSNKIHGARVSGNEFKNYPKNELEKNKKFINEKNNNKERLSLYIIYDWKYIDRYRIESKKINSDISKQLCYESSIKNYKNTNKIESQFVIPYFYSTSDIEDEIGSFIDSNDLCERLKNTKIKVFKANFKKIQEIYLNHD